MKFPLQNVMAKAMFWKGEGTINPVYENGDPENDDAEIGDAEIGYVENDKPDDSVEVTVWEQESTGVGRQQWSSPVEFLLSCIAMSVGLGNVWRFPFVALQNGGGAFLIPYILVLVLIGKPLYYMELCMGQFASFGCVKVWAIAPAFTGVGYAQAFATFAVVTYYVSLMGLTVYYFFASFTSVLPWSVCGDWTNELTCMDANTNVTALEITKGINATSLSSAAEEYFRNEVLKIDDNGLDNGIDAPEWRMSMCLLFSWLVLFVVLAKGVQSSGKAAYFTALFPYLVLFIMLIRGCTLPGAYTGIKFFLNPKWEKLLEPEVWFAAVDQSFFSLSVGFGCIMMFSSYNSFRHNVYRDAAIISITDTLTSLLAGLTTFAILGHLAEQLGVDVKDVVKGGGTTLAFISYPDVLSRFQYVPQIFSLLFFLMLFTLGVGSASALTGCIVTIISDQFPNLKRWMVTLVVCSAGFLLGLFYVTPQGQFILELINYYGGGFIILIMVVLEMVAVHWVYGVNRFCRDIEFMLGKKTGCYWKFCWAFLIPVCLAIIFIYSQAVAKPLTAGSYVFGPEAIGVGIFLTVFACLLVPLCFFLEVMQRRKESATLCDAMKNTFKPTAKWCPKDPILRRQYFHLLADENPALEGIDSPIPPGASTLPTSSFDPTPSPDREMHFNTNV